MAFPGFYLQPGGGQDAVFGCSDRHDGLTDADIDQIRFVLGAVDLRLVRDLNYRIVHYQPLGYQVYRRDHTFDSLVTARRHIRGTSRLPDRQEY